MKPVDYEEVFEKISKPTQGGQRTNMHSCKHDAQVEWNERFGRHV